MKIDTSKFVAWVFGLLSVVLFLLLAGATIKLQHTQADLRLTRDVVWRIDVDRRHALKSDVVQAVQYLQMFNVPSEWDTGFDKQLASIISLVRENAVQDVIAYLRDKTGKDFGDDPKKWIEALNDEAVRTEKKP
jgi:hypothetical protein